MPAIILGSSRFRSRAATSSVAAILAGLRVARTRARDQRVVIFGAGTAGVGIADQIRTI
jgi:malic enzyme